jgi:hypothetical protein
LWPKSLSFDSLEKQYKYVPYKRFFPRQPVDNTLVNTVGFPRDVFNENKPSTGWHSQPFHLKNGTVDDMILLERINQW